MEEKIIKSVITVCRAEELTDGERTLIDKAIEATYRSYAKYSHFNVGAAVRLANGTDVIGCNQENAAYPVTLCAERTALFSAAAQYPDQPVVMIAIAARNASGLLAEPITPCGSCRQVLIETEQRYGRSIRILLYGTNHVYVIDGIKHLMPLSFNEEQL